MKHTPTKVLLAISALILVQPAQAATSIGLKAWQTTWDSSSPGEETSSAGSMLIGPSIKYGNEHFFAGGSIMTSLSAYEDNYIDDFGDPISDELDRTDIDLVIGKMLHPRAGVFFGIKSINFSGTSDDPVNSYTISTDYTTSGFGAGIALNKPITDTIVAFGTLSYMSLSGTIDYSDTDGNSESIDLDSSGATLEFGLSMAISSSLSGSLSYKSQSFSYDEAGWGNDDMYGLAASINIAL